MAAAKAYSLGLGKPLYGVNHLAAHVAVDQLEHGPLPKPCVALLVSGGHSSLLLVPDVASDVRPLGATVDDAAGEAFDKVARVLDLGFPGGPYIDRAAREGDPARSPSRAASTTTARYDFSFSGLKTAVARWVESRERAGEPVPVADVAAAFQEAVVDVLTKKAIAACKDNGVSHLLDRRRCGGQLAAAGAGPGALRRRRASGCGCRGRSCAPTTARWWPRSAPSSSAPGWSPSALDLPGRLVPADHRDPGLTAQKRAGAPSSTRALLQRSPPARASRTRRCDRPECSGSRSSTVRRSQ